MERLGWENFLDICRITTLHSNKCSNFLLVLLYIPCLYFRREYLLCGGITRAIDNPNAFTPGVEDPIIAYLIAGFAGQEA